MNNIVCDVKNNKPIHVGNGDDIALCCDSRRDYCVYAHKRKDDSTYCEYISKCREERKNYH